MVKIALMLSECGYDLNANPPTYGKPDEEVIHNEEEIKRNKDEWDEKGELVKKLSKKETGPRGRGFRKRPANTKVAPKDVFY